MHWRTLCSAMSVVLLVVSRICIFAMNASVWPAVTNVVIGVMRVVFLFVVVSALIHTVLNARMKQTLTLTMNKKIIPFLLILYYVFFQLHIRSLT